MLRKYYNYIRYNCDMQCTYCIKMFIYQPYLDTNCVSFNQTAALNWQI